MALWTEGRCGLVDPPPGDAQAILSADGLGLGLPAGRGHAKPCRPGSSRLPPPRAPGPSLGFAVGRILAPGGLGASGWRTPESSGRSLKALRASAPRGPLLVLETQPAQGSEPGGAGFRSTETGGQIRRPSEPEAELPNSRCWRTRFPGPGVTCGLSAREPQGGPWEGRGAPHGHSAQEPVLWWDRPLPLCSSLVCACMCVHVCLSTCVCGCVGVRVCKCACDCKCVHACVWACKCACAHMHVCACVGVQVRLSMCV